MFGESNDRTELSELARSGEELGNRLEGRIVQRLSCIIIRSAHYLVTVPGVIVTVVIVGLHCRSLQKMSASVLRMSSLMVKVSNSEHTWQCCKVQPCEQKFLATLRMAG